MLLTDFKLVKEDADSYHLAHPAGRKFAVNKKGLNEKAHAAIKNLQHFDEGGAVEPDPHTYGSIGDTIVGASRGLQKIPGILSNIVDPSNPNPLSADAPPTPDPANDSTAAPPTVARATPADLVVPPAAEVSREPQTSDLFTQNRNDTENLINAQEKDVKDYLKSMQGVGGGEAKAYGDYSDKLEAMHTPQQIADSYKAKDDALVKAFTDNKIDPERYWHNKSTGSKVAAGIGVLLAGMGSHATGGRNLALDQINDSINKDIDAQKNSQDKSFNLWKMNRAAMDTDMHANLATQNQYLSLAQAKVMKFQAGATSANAKLRAGELIGQLEQQKIQNRFKLGLMSQGSGGRPSAMDPAQMVTALVPEPHQKEVFTEIKQAQNAGHNEKAALDAFDKAVSENSVVGRVSRLGFTPPSIKTLNALADPLIHDNEGRINELEQKHVQALWPSPGDLDSTVKQKRQAFQNFIDQKKAAPTAKGFGINLENFQSTGTPAAAPEIKTMDGVRYQKVAGGWKRVG